MWSFAFSKSIFSFHFLKLRPLRLGKFFLIKSDSISFYCCHKSCITPLFPFWYPIWMAIAIKESLNLFITLIKDYLLFHLTTSMKIVSHHEIWNDFFFFFTYFYSVDILTSQFKTIRVDMTFKSVSKQKAINFESRFTSIIKS